MNLVKSNVFFYAIIACALTVIFSRFTTSTLDGEGAATGQILARKLDEGPIQVPDWEIKSQAPLDEEQARVLQCFSSSVGNYVAPKTGDSVVAAVILGPHGPTSLHDPNVCYPAAGYKVTKEPTRETFRIGDKDVTLWTTQMQKGDVGVERIKVAWGWNDGTGWSAPDSARVTFAGKPYLIKIQVVLELQNRPGDDEKGLHRFLEGFLPSLEQRLQLEPPTTTTSA